MTQFKNDNSDMQASISEAIFKAASEGNVEGVRSRFALLPSLSKDCRDKRGWTPLMLASRNGHVDVIKTLLEDGADPKAFNSSGQNAFEIASFWNQGPALKALTNFLKPPKTPELELVNYFSHGVLDRQSYKRTQEEHINSSMTSDKSRFVVFGNLQLLVSHGSGSESKNQVVYLSWNEIKRATEGMPESAYDVIFLGVGDIEKGVLLRETFHASEDALLYFGINFKQMPTEEQIPIKDMNGEYVGRGYRSGITFIKKEESGLIAQARSVLAWHDKYIFCPTCGSKTEMAEAGYKRVCMNSDCISQKGAHSTSFPRTDPVVIILVISVDGTKCLLGRQKRFPTGVYSCVAGFMEPGETIEDAARREVLEETGVKVGKLQYHSSQPWPFPSNLMIGLIGNAVCDDIEVDEVELEDAKWFARPDVVKALTEGFHSDGLKVPPATAIAHQLIKAWVKMSSNL